MTIVVGVVGAGIVILLGMVVLLMLWGRRDARAHSSTKPATAAEPEPTDAELEAVGLSLADIKRYEKGAECSFWFVKADKIRDWHGAPPGSLQTLRKDRSDWLERQVIRFVDGYRGKYRDRILVVSHRWETPEAPDDKGDQWAAIRKHVIEDTRIELVWFDFWCMPQGKSKTAVEKREFATMLPNINLLYLTATVLILLDMSYMSRFWTQFEAYLSMRTLTQDGLGSLQDDRHARHKIVTLGIAQEKTAEQLVEMWANKTPDEAHETLRSPDVTVTNQGDKDTQLKKLEKLDQNIRKMVEKLTEVEV